MASRNERLITFTEHHSLECHSISLFKAKMTMYLSGNQDRLPVEQEDFVLDLVMRREVRRGVQSVH